MIDMYPHSITFRKYTETPDGGGGQTRTWSDLLTTDGFVDPISGKQRYQAMQQVNPTNIRVYFPYNAENLTVDGTMKVVWNDRGLTLDVQSDPMDQGGQGEILMVECYHNG